MAGTIRNRLFLLELPNYRAAAAGNLRSNEGRCTAADPVAILSCYCPSAAVNFPLEYCKHRHIRDFQDHFLPLLLFVFSPAKRDDADQKNGESSLNYYGWLVGMETTIPAV